MKKYKTPLNRVLYSLCRKTVGLLVLGVFLLVAVFLAATPQTAQAATAGTLNFQARLQTNTGAIVPDGTYNVEFKLYNVASGGSTQWTEDYLNNAAQGVTVKNGYLTVNLGSITLFPGTINWDQDQWLTMTVRGTGSCAFAACTPADAEMGPNRLKLTATPYAFRAGQLATGNGTLQSTLSIIQPTVGNQIFQIQDQAAAGTYNLCIQNSVACGFAASVGALSNTSTPNGGSISGGVLTLNVADGTNGGLLSAAANPQTIGGVKTFTGQNITNATVAGDFALEGKNSSATGLGIYGFTNNNTNTNDVLRLDGSGGTVFSVKSNGNITAVGTYNSNTFTSSALTFGAAATATVQSAAGQALNITGHGNSTISTDTASSLTLTSAAAATWSTSAGLLTVQGAGGVTVASTAGTTSSNVILQSGNASAGASGNVTVDTGTFTSGTPTLNLGNANAKTIQVGNTTNTTTVGLDLATGGTLNIANGAQTHTINIGAGGAVQTIHIGDGAAANNVQVGSSNGAATTAINAGTAGLNIGNNGIANTIQIGNTTGAVAQTVNIGNNATASSSSAVVIGSTVAGNVTLQSAATIAIGNNAAAQTLNIGNVTGATALNERVGTGNYTLDGVAGTTYTIGASTTTGTITLGGTAQTGTMTLGSSSGTNTLNIANGAGATTLNLANVQTGGAVNIGSAMTTGTISIGGTGAQTGTLTIGGGTGAQALAFGAGGTGQKTITIGGTGASGGSNAATVVNVQGGATNLKLANSGATVQTFTNVGTAFQVQDSVGAPVFLVDTTAPNNLLTNPGFEVGSPPTGWAAVAPGTIAQNVTKSNSFNGLFSLSLTTTAANGGATTSSFTGTVAAGTYTVSFYVKPSTAMNASGLTVTINDGTARTCSPAAQTLSTTGFIRVSCTPAATTANLVSLTIAQNDSSARTIFIDAVQLQSGASATPYQVGSIQLRGTIANPVAIQTASDSTTAFQIQNAAGTSNLVVADTLNGRLGVGTATPAERLDIEGGNVRIGAQTNAVTAFSRISSGTAGDIGSTSGTHLIDSPFVSIVYNGSLYVGTSEPGKGEIYRYDGGTTWTKVTQATAGTIASGGTAAIDDITSLVAFNGYLYAGTFKTGAAEIYRYDGGTTWTKVTQATAGTIASGGTAGINGVEQLIVYDGKLFAGTDGSSEVYRYDGGTTWAKVSGAAGQIGGTAGQFQLNMKVYNNQLYAGTSNTGAAEILRYDGGTTWTKVTPATAGTIGTGGGGTAINQVSAFAVYNGALYAATGFGTTAGGEVYRYNPSASSTNWTKVSSATNAGFCGDTAANNVSSLTVYNGRLYAGSESSTNGASVCRYDGDLGGNASTLWTRVSNAQGQVSAGSSAVEEEIHSLIAYNGSLIALAGTNSGTNADKAEIHSYTAVEGQSYALNFNAASNNANAEQNGNLNLGSISFLGEQNGTNGPNGNTGSFLFSHGITTANGSYDLAEDYPTRDDSLAPGDLVAADPNEAGLVKKANGPAETTVGIYSEKPGFRLSQTDGTIDGVRAVPIALAGRVPLKVTSANGDIKAGDYLAASSIPGVAVKATHAGPVVGRALAAYASSNPAAVGRVMVLINLSWYDPGVMTGLQGGTVTSEATASDGSLAIQDQGSAAATTGGATTTTTPALQGGDRTLTSRVDNLTKQTTDLVAQFKDLQTTVNNLGANLNAGTMDLAGLNVSGNASVKGDLSIAGTATLVTLQLTGHFITQGDAPTISLQAAAGSVDESAKYRAKVELVGNDTSGTIKLTVGDNPGADRLVRLDFHKPFDSAPRVLVTALGKDSSSLPVYVDDAQNAYFILGSSAAPQPGQTYQYTYYVVQ